ncbi:hypothetical protein M413DRAFT_443357 [Hebeloma cylindrosporum]|uniref:Alanine dehydrogenase/pyridine nucleotide transhydrogenase N-terminal domain-containing protein n=1 Tax=Hebeloma cylindrosporum TaxID=76867 RepID=A0A0C2YTM1_HEBCY|nr:hypothetical protein M413DRAFT_443357 [Hebeloma cylindrosporum h7]
MSLHGILSRIARNPVEIAIRAEDPSRIWERRVPLTPDAVYKLISTRLATVKVVSSSRRVFNDREYRKAGASVVPSLKDTNPDIVLGIKEPPLAEVPLPSSLRTKSPTHLMFSHTAKGQAYNMPLLARFVAPSKALDESKAHFPRLIDYELLTDEAGKRTVGFGWFAGAAGVLESLAAMAQHHLELGIASPFLHTPRPYALPTLDKLRESLRHIGSSISQHGTPPELGPFVIGLTGTGQVAQGCLSMLKELPIEMIPVDQLENLMTRWTDGAVDSRKIYLVHAKASDYLVRVDGGAYDRDHYYQSPQSYTSLFCDKVAPYLTLFLNGTGWAPSFPRLMTSEQLQTAMARAKSYPGFRFTNIGDISCDVGGGLEFLPRSTTLTQPTVNVDVLPANNPAAAPSAVRMMAVDILPASVPLDASRHFSDALQPYLMALIGDKVGTSSAMESSTSASSSPSSSYLAALRRATIAEGGVLAPKHSWLQSAVDQVVEKAASASADVDATPAATTVAAVADVEPSSGVITASDVDSSVDGAASSSSSSSSVAASEPLQPMRRINKKILLLGSGMVAQPAVDMIASHEGVELVIASNSLLELQNLAGPHLKVKYVVIDVAKPFTYVNLIRDADVVISLLPAHMHPTIARECIKAGTHMVTASYTSPEMAQLHESAMARDVLILNEIGLDPGIDHCSALSLINGIRSANPEEKIVSFTSFCGGLPAPEDSHVPLRYKFSWRPQGVLSAALNEARYMLSSKVHTVPGRRLLESVFPKLPITKKFELEGLLNRDSLKYMVPYGLDQSKMETFVRGTLRYPGFSSLMHSFSSLGFLNNQSTLVLDSWDTFAWRAYALLPQHSGYISNQNKKHHHHHKGLPDLTSLVTVERVQPLLEALEWLGLVKPVVLEGPRDMPPLPREKMTPLDLFAYLLAHKLRYRPNERDMVVLSNEVITVRTRGVGGGEGEGEGAGRSSEQQQQQPWRRTTVHTSTLISYGTKMPNVGFKGERPASAMARTVGIPVALAALYIADGTISSSSSTAQGQPWTGVQSPLMPFVYTPILDGLKKVGITFDESRKVVRRVPTTSPGGFKLRMGCGTVEDSLRATSLLRESDTLGGVYGFGFGNGSGFEKGIGNGIGNGQEGGLKNDGGGGVVYDLDEDKGWNEDDVLGWDGAPRSRGLKV